MQIDIDTYIYYRHRCSYRLLHWIMDYQGDIDIDDIDVDDIDVDNIDIDIYCRYRYM